MSSVTKWVGRMAAVLAPMVLWAGTAHAGGVITFEGFREGTLITNQYAARGVTFQGDTTILRYPYYNYFGYPPHSHRNVVYSPTDGYITAVSTNGTWTSAGAWYSAPYGLTLDAYDAHGNLITSVTGGGVYGYDAFLSVSAPGIAWVSFVGTPNFFTLDDFTASGITTPEPSTFALAGIGGLTLVGYLWRRRRAAVA